MNRFSHGISLLLFPALLMAQGKLTRHGLMIDRQARPAPITGEEKPGEIVRTVKPHSGHRSMAFGPGKFLMDSFYDYGSNGGVLTNLWDYGDGTLAVGRMAATQGPAPTSPDRGTYWTYFDGVNWYPMTKVEQVRRGWSNISALADGRNVTVSHVANEVNVDALPGFGIWTSFITGFATSAAGQWPRLTIDGDGNIIICSTTNGNVTGIQFSKEIAISRDEGLSWTHQVLLPDTLTHTPIFNADDQSLDSFGDKVAFAVSEFGWDVHLWESPDNGASWNYRNLTNYPADIPVGAEELRAYDACDVIYDNDGDLHVFWESILATQDAPGTPLEFSYSRNAGIQHWSEGTGQVQAVSWADLPGSELESDRELFLAGSPFDQANADFSLVGQPQAGVDAGGSLFLLFAALRPLDYDPVDSTHFTDLFAVRSDDGGANWGVPINITDTPQSEDLWASLADNVGDSLRFVYQSDDNTGNELQGGGVAPTRLLYYAYPKSNIPSGNLEGRHLLASPRLLSFGRAFVGDTTAGRTILLRSAGTEPVTVSAIVLSGADFVLLNAPATPFVLAPDNSISFQVAFAPAAGGVLNGTVTITSDDVDDPVKTVNLSGIGAFPPPPGTALFVVNEFTGTIQELDPVSGEILRNIPVPLQSFSGVAGLAYDGVSLFYTPGFNFNRIYELDPESGTVRNSFTTPNGVTIDALGHSGSSLLALAYGTRTIYELDPSTGQINNTITTPVFIRGGMTYGGSRQSIFAQMDFGEVVEIDPFTGDIINRFFTPNGEFFTGLGYSERLQALFGGSSFSGTVYAMDPDNGAVLNTFPNFGFSSLSGLAADEYLLLSGPHVLVRPREIDFGKVGLGQTTAGRRVTLRNIGTEEVTVTGVSRSEVSFRLLGLPEFPLTLQPSTFVTFEVAFSPERPEEVSDTLQVFSTDADDPVQHLLLSGVGVRPPRPGTLFASTGQTETLATINPATGQGTAVGSTTGFGRVIELEFREDGALFGFTDFGYLITLDVITGAPTLVNTPFVLLTALEFSADGTLYGAYTPFSGAFSQLVTIDVNTGFLTFIGSINFQDVSGLSFAPDGSLLGVTGGFFSGGNLIRINVNTGNGSLIGSTGFRDVAALEFDRQGRLYGGLGPNDANSGRIITIDPASGAGAIIGPSGFPEISGLSFLPGFDVTVAISDTLIAEAGTEIEVPLMLELNADSVGSLGAILKATGGILSFTGFTPGPIIPGATFDVHAPAPDSVRIGFANLGGGNITQPGLLATLRFNIAAGAPLGATSLLRFDEVTATDPEGGILVAGAINGLVTVVKFVSIAGNVQYCLPPGHEGQGGPVEGLAARLSRNGVLHRQAATDDAGNFTIENAIAGPDYFLALRRASGGVDSAVHVTDAFLAFNGFLGTVALSGCQSLAADVDANLSVQPRDALLIFNYFLGKLAAFPAEAWRTFPASYDIDAAVDAWKSAPEGIAYANILDNLTEQNFLAVARGDVDLTWPDSLLAAGLAKTPAPGGGLSLQLVVHSAPLAPGAKKITWQIALESAKAMPDIFAFGAELRYEAAALEITQVRWGRIIPAEGFIADHNILPVIAAPANVPGEPGLQKLVGRMRFGGFATSPMALQQAGVLLEVEAQLHSALPVGTRLPLRLANVAVTARRAGANGVANAGFAQIKIAAKDGAVETADIPTEYALQANYPNPFNPSTKIRYQLPEAAAVKIEIYNALGQKVRELLQNAEQQPGYYTIEWDGRNAQGLPATSGVYFLKLEAQSPAKRFAQTRKMLLVK